MGNNPSSSSLVLPTITLPSFLPGDEVKIARKKYEVENDRSEHQLHIDRPYVVENIVEDESEKDEFGKGKCGVVVVESQHANKVVGVYKPEELILLNNEPNQRRRVEYRLLKKYVGKCKELQIEPNGLVLQCYGQHAKQGICVYKLDLRGKNLKCPHLRAICELFDDESALSKLDLSFNDIKSLGCSYLSKIFIHNNVLREINLKNNDLGVKGAQYLADGLKVNTSLACLNVDQTNIGPSGCNYIIEALLKNKNSTIVKLDLRRNGIGDIQVQNLLRLAMQNKSLCFVDMYPPTADMSNESSSDNFNSGWLSYEGWLHYGNLRSTLKANMEYVGGNPDVIEPKKTSKPKINNAEDAFDYILYNLTLLKDEIIGPVKEGESATYDNQIKEEVKEIVSGKQKRNPKSSFEQWKKQRNIAAEWVKLTPEHSRLLQLETQLKKECQGKLKTSDKDSGDSTQLNVGTTCSNDTEDWCILDDEFADEAPVSPQIRGLENISLNTKSIDKRKSKKLLSSDIDFTSIVNAGNSQEKNAVMCNICLDEKKISEIYILDDCWHKFCIDCLQNYIAIKVNSFETDTISCPECNVKISPNQVKQLIKLRSPGAGNRDTLITKFEDFTLKKALASMKNLVWCPNVQCNNGMIIDTSRNSVNSNGASTPESDNIGVFKVECRECGAGICSACKDFYHPGMNCEQHKQTKLSKSEFENLELYNQWVKKHRVKKCPGCGIDVEKKFKSCNEMNCNQCGTKWCFSCGNKMTDLKEHYKNCQKWNILDAFGLIGQD